MLVAEGWGGFRRIADEQTEAKGKSGGEARGGGGRR